MWARLRGGEIGAIPDIYLHAKFTKPAGGMQGECQGQISWTAFGIDRKPKSWLDSKGVNGKPMVDQGLAPWP